MKNEVYSWRVAAEKKLALESEAMREGKSVAELLDDISSKWLEERRAASADDEAEQKKLRSRALKLAGSLAGGDPNRASRSSARIKENLAKRYGRGSH